MTSSIGNVVLAELGGLGLGTFLGRAISFDFPGENWLFQSQDAFRNETGLPQDGSGRDRMTQEDPAQVRRETATQLPAFVFPSTIFLSSVVCNMERKMREGKMGGSAAADRSLRLSPACEFIICLSPSFLSKTSSLPPARSTSLAPDRKMQWESGFDRGMS
jgi:hypothetical protein